MAPISFESAEPGKQPVGEPEIEQHGREVQDVLGIRIKAEYREQR